MRRFVKTYIKYHNASRNISKWVTLIQSRSTSTHFGFEQVNENEKEKRVHQVFANVAKKYDLMNDVMSFGIHRLWKDYYVGALPIRPMAKILDVAGGTGDIAFRLARRISHDGKVTVFDINQNMLDVGLDRAQKDPSIVSSRLEWVCGNAEKLPFDNNIFDLYTISFGIRNCTHVDKVISEAFRVLKPGGTFAVLEFSEVNSMLKPFYDAYSFNIIPVMGEVLASDHSSYKYLVESIRKFPNQNDFASMILDAGFNEVNYENLTFGVCAIHKGTKPRKAV
uniref:2-methoxy-6-polyprenyl-1,4-benzoquinol methylase, mitochondrial n=1 Tax=Heterorhabditis bacteriophora TaxID=37862 RepID=A0A1I7XTY8_HETBA